MDYESSSTQYALTGANAAMQQQLLCEQVPILALPMITMISATAPTPQPLGWEGL
jgi:hypothetical protein